MKCTNVVVGYSASCDDNKQKGEERENITPKALNFEEYKRGEGKNDDNMAPKKDGEPQTSKSVNPGEEKELERLAQSIGDLPGYKPTEVDQKLKEVYGDYLHQNDGSHLDGGIQDDAEW